MISKTFGISCSPRCEKLLAVSFLREGSRVKSMAHQLASDGDRTTVRLAEALASLPPEEARELALQTLTIDRR